MALAIALAMMNATTIGTLAHVEMLGNKVKAETELLARSAQDGKWGRTVAEKLMLEAHAKQTARAHQVWLMDLRAAYKAILNGSDAVTTLEAIKVPEGAFLSGTFRRALMIAKGEAQVHPRVLAAATVKA